MLKQIIVFSWRNIWRNRRRTLLTATAIALGIAALIFYRAYVGGFFNNACDAIIKTDCGHIKIAQREFLRLAQMMPKEQLVTDMATVRRLIAQTPGISSVLERVQFRSLLSLGGNNEPAVAMGIDPSIAAKTMGLAQAITRGRYFSGQGLELIIGTTMAKKLRVRVGQELLLVTSDINYSTFALPFTVAGIFKTGYPTLDNHLVFIPLAKAREMIDCGDAAHDILLYIREPQQSVTVAADLGRRLATAEPGQDLVVVSWQENDFVKKMGPFFQTVVKALQYIIMLLCGLVILNTMLMTVMERYQEIGVMKALGFQNREVTGMILIEAFFIGVIGALSGGLVGGAVSAIVSKTGINVSRIIGQEIFEKIDIQAPIFGEFLYPQVNAAMVIGSVLFGIAIALVAVFYPAYKSARMTPVEAFRTQLKV